MESFDTGYETGLNFSECVRLEGEVELVWYNLEREGAAVVDVFETKDWHQTLTTCLREMAKDAGVSLRFYDRTNGSYRITLRRYGLCTERHLSV